MQAVHDARWRKMFYRYPDEQVLETRITKSETRLSGLSSLGRMEDEALAGAKARFQTAVSRMKVLRASFEAARQRQEMERRVFSEQFAHTRKELLTAYRTHRGLLRGHAESLSFS